MLDSVREAITATAVNKRGHVDIVSLHRKDGATQIVFKASPAQSVIFPAMIDQPSLTRIRSGLIQELMLTYGLRPMWANEQGDEIRFALPKWYAELKHASLDLAVCLRDQPPSA
jgi:hypothetical protein